ncbi:hypothetical protein B0H17DRAFT_1140028 [Mycena rosella]|uniref:F-box domain-containing protein n=1 Tax=Mycena rosella TaxID=1033263 RepID=A0AAD7G7Z3_MYCRO|nr:hypothetical protein B0H17DRAFT_1140028 [Mycena rosella]
MEMQRPAVVRRFNVEHRLLKTNEEHEKGLERTWIRYKVNKSAGSPERESSGIFISILGVRPPESMNGGILNPKPHSKSLIPVPPIRRLPTELLVEIFQQCWAAFTPSFEDITSGQKKAVLKTEIARLAHGPLLKLSQVCSGWHTIVLGTPSLVRYKDHTIAQMSSGTRGQFPAHHNDHRWGNLPRLEALDIRLWPDDDEPSTVDLFEAAPSLRSLSYRGPLIAISKLPMEQLSVFRYADFDPEESEEGFILMSLLKRLPRAAVFRFQFSLYESIGYPWETTTLEVSPGTSDIATLGVALVRDFDSTHCIQMLNSIFANLTLPLLENIMLESHAYPHSVLPWPHHQFLSLVARSSFDTHLRSLEIYDVCITHAQLLEGLSHLPSLERIAISDHQLVDDYRGGGIYELLITDSLFSKLTTTADELRLVPRLRSIHCRSLLQFDDTAYLAFILSREQTVARKSILFIPKLLLLLSQTDRRPRELRADPTYSVLARSLFWPEVWDCLRVDKAAMMRHMGGLGRKAHAPLIYDLVEPPMTPTSADFARYPVLAGNIMARTAPSGLLTAITRSYSLPCWGHEYKL